MQRRKRLQQLEVVGGAIGILKLFFERCYSFQSIGQMLLECPDAGPFSIGTPIPSWVAPKHSGSASSLVPVCRLVEDK
jgi:hypothetical protein